MPKMIEKENILIIIAARGGSKGLKNKNITTINKKPLIAYTIEQAMAWGKASNIVCSTDSIKIAKTAMKYNAVVPFIRAKTLSGDKVAKVEVLKDALIRCEKIYQKTYQIIVDLDVTAPIRKISDLDNCLKMFKKYKPKTLFSVVQSRKNPYFNMVERGKDGRAFLCKTLKKPIFSRQDAPIVYDMNASIYFYSRDFLINSNKVTAITDDSIVYVMEEVSRFDIDSKMDLKFIQFLIEEGIFKNEL